MSQERAPCVKIHDKEGTPFLVIFSRTSVTQKHCAFALWCQPTMKQDEAHQNHGKTMPKRLARKGFHRAGIISGPALQKDSGGHWAAVWVRNSETKFESSLRGRIFLAITAWEIRFNIWPSLVRQDFPQDFWWWWKGKYHLSSLRRLSGFWGERKSGGLPLPAWDVTLFSKLNHLWVYSNGGSWGKKSFRNFLHMSAIRTFENSHLIRASFCRTVCNPEWTCD